MRRDGRRVRVTARLVRCSDQSQVWAETYERTLDDVLGVQREIARSAASGIGITLDPRGAAPPRARPSPIPRRGASTCSDAARSTSAPRRALGRARRHFEAALADAPDYAPAHAGLADVWSVLVDQGQVPPAEGLPGPRLSPDGPWSSTPRSTRRTCRSPRSSPSGAATSPRPAATSSGPSRSTRPTPSRASGTAGSSPTSAHRRRRSSRRASAPASIPCRRRSSTTSAPTCSWRAGPRRRSGCRSSSLETHGEAMLSHLLNGSVLSSLGRSTTLSGLWSARTSWTRAPRSLSADRHRPRRRRPEAEAAQPRTGAPGLLPARPYIKVGVASVAAAVGEREVALRLLEQAVESPRDRARLREPRAPTSPCCAATPASQPSRRGSRRDCFLWVQPSPASWTVTR